MKIEPEFNKLHFWYWGVSWLLIAAGLAGYADAFLAVTALAAVQIAHYRMLRGSFTAFAVQVRIAALLMFTAGLFFPILYWIPAVGLLARITVNYCLMARLLKLLPWNRKGQKLTVEYVRKTIFSPPAQGPI